MNSVKRSTVWLYFTLHGHYTECNMCKYKITYRSGSTSNKRKHINSKHSFIDLNAQSAETPGSITQARSITPPDMKKSQPAHRWNATVSPFVDDVTMDEDVFDEIIDCESPVARTDDERRLDDLLVNMCVKDLRPFSFVDSSAFRDYSSGLNASYELPTKTTLVRTTLPQRYQSASANLQDKLENIWYVTFTTNCWFSSTNELYTAVTAYFINADWALESVILDCLHSPGSHNTSENNLNSVRRVARKWNLHEKIHAILTEGPAPLESNLGFEHITCAAHTINVIIKDALLLVQKLTNKLRSIVKHIQDCDQSTDAFFEIQSQVYPSKTPQKLVVDKDGEWRSTFKMLRIVSDVSEALEATVTQLDLDTTISRNEFGVISELCEMLQPFDKFLTELSTNSTTASNLIVMCNLVKPYLESIVMSDTVSEIRDTILRGMKNLFGNLECVPTYAISTFLDPRFKSRGFNNPQEYEFAMGLVQNLVVSLIESTNGVDANRESKRRAIDEDSIWSWFDREAAGDIADETPQSRARLELREYAQKPLIARTSDALAWWRTHEAQFPHLSQVAKRYLSLVAMSAPCERLFSNAGGLLSGQPKDLSSIQQILFLNSFLKINH